MKQSKFHTNNKFEIIILDFICLFLLLNLFSCINDEKKIELLKELKIDYSIKKEKLIEQGYLESADSYSFIGKLYGDSISILYVLDQKTNSNIISKQISIQFKDMGFSLDSLLIDLKLSRIEESNQLKKYKFIDFFVCNSSKDTFQCYIDGITNSELIISTFPSIPQTGRLMNSSKIKELQEMVIQKTKFKQ